MNHSLKQENTWSEGNVNNYLNINNFNHNIHEINASLLHINTSIYISTPFMKLMSVTKRKIPFLTNIKKILVNINSIKDSYLFIY